ncbi:MAG: GNAT family N-acetyltransferase [Bacteroidota bacterium]
MIFVRAARPEDVKAVFRFIEELEDEKLNYQHFERIYLQNLANVNHFYLVAELNDEAIGFISCHTQLLLHHCGRVGEIQELFVAAAHRSKKVGQLLIEAIERIAVEENWINLEVTCNKKRVRTHGFYRKNDFYGTHLKFVKEIVR